LFSAKFVYRFFVERIWDFLLEQSWKKQQRIWEKWEKHDNLIIKYDKLCSRPKINSNEEMQRIRVQTDLTKRRTLPTNRYYKQLWWQSKWNYTIRLTWNRVPINAVQWHIFVVGKNPLYDLDRITSQVQLVQC
jgi:hypothetical protein